MQQMELTARSHQIRLFNLKDSSLYYLNTSKYQNSLVSDKYSKYFSWTSGRPDLPTYYTDTELGNLGDEQEKNVILLESSAIIPHQIKWVGDNHKLFKNIYTHNSSLLSSCSNARWIAGGGIWVGGEFGGGEMKIYDKTKLCSFVSSDKTMCPLHKLRLECAKFSRFKYKHIDHFGTAFGTFTKAIDYTRDYKFSIIFENYIDDMYFTEKILNCFATGTIPIYMGARKISSIFDGRGILTFSSASELFQVITDVMTDDFYDSKTAAVRNNFDICKEFECVEDFMYENYIMKDEIHE